jgi:hypothetical protein
VIEAALGKRGNELRPAIGLKSSSFEGRRDKNLLPAGVAQ